MFLDIVVLALLVLAIVKGFKQGLVLAALSFIAIFIGLAAALKCSTLVARWLGNAENVGASWLPLLAFILIMAGVFFGVKMLSVVIEQMLELSMLGWANKLGGILMYTLLYLTVFSVLIFYTEKMELLSQSSIQSSQTYPYIHLWGPFAVEGLGMAIPFFKDLFTDLTDFFEAINKNKG